MDPFIYTGLPMRVVFGEGSIARLPEEVEKLGARRALVLSTPGRGASVRKVAESLGGRLAGIYDKAAMHVPVEIAEDARRVAEELGADCCISVGGGSTTGLGKAIALTSGLPIIAVPTTYSGSEMTTILGMTEGGLKKTLRDPRVLPRTVIYDPALTLGLPVAISAASGMNAIAHCVEALYAADGNPINSLQAEEGIRAMAAALPRVVRAPEDMQARSDALYGVFCHDRHGPASQAVPCAWRHVRPATCRDAQHRPAACGPLQPGCRARSDGPHCAGPWRAGRPAGPA
jgi:maleylacetate reductase